MNHGVRETRLYVKARLLVLECARNKVARVRGKHAMGLVVQNHAILDGATDGLLEIRLLLAGGVLHGPHHLLVFVGVERGLEEGPVEFLFLLAGVHIESGADHLGFGRV